MLETTFQTQKKTSKTKRVPKRQNTLFVKNIQQTKPSLLNLQIITLTISYNVWIKYL